MPDKNNIKKSAALLAFFISAAAWVTVEAKKEPRPIPADVSVQSENPNTDIVLRPLTD